MSSYSGSREIEIDLYKDENDGWCRADDDEPIPAKLAEFVEAKARHHAGAVCLSFEMTYSGSYTPAYTSGAPEDCYPAEGEEYKDWEVPELVLVGDGMRDSKSCCVPPEVLADKEVTDLFETAIDAEEITDDDRWND